MTQYIRNKTPPMRDMMDCLHLPNVLHRYEVCACFSDGTDYRSKTLVTKIGFCGFRSHLLYTSLM